MQRGFYRIASLLGEPVSPAEAYDAAAQAAAEALGGDFAAVLARGAGGLVFVGGHELPPEVRELPIPQAFADAADDGQMLAAPELARDGRFGDAWRDVQFSSLLAIPVRGAQAELVLVFFDDAHTFSQRGSGVRAAGRPRRARRVRAQSALRRRADVPLAGAAARADRQPARDRARSGGGPRRGGSQAVDLLRVEAAALASLDERDLVVTAAAGDGAQT